MNTITCPGCNGGKYVDVYTWHKGEAIWSGKVRCTRCDGEGVVPAIEELFMAPPMGEPNDPLVLPMEPTADELQAMDEWFEISMADWVAA